MTHQSPIRYVPGAADAGGQIAQLRDVLRLVEQIAGREPGGGDSALEESARISSAYGNAQPVVQKRFDALVAETASWAAVAAEALVEGEAGQAAASALADELEHALRDLARIIRQDGGTEQPEIRLPSWLDARQA